MKRKVFIFIGPPGSGKGSLSNLCVDKLGWVQVSTGNLCRKHIMEQTAIGKEIDFALKSGKLVSDDLIIAMVEDWISEQIEKHDALILDGFPRTVVQAKALDQLVKDKFTSIDLQVVKFSVADQTVIDRLGSRYTCQNKDCQRVYSLAVGANLAPQRGMICDDCSSPLSRRKDDEAEAIKERLITYHKHAKDLLDFYTETGRSIQEFNVERPLQELFQDFKSVIGADCGSK